MAGVTSGCSWSGGPGGSGGSAPSAWSLTAWLEGHAALLSGLFALSLVSLVLVLALLPRVVARLPVDYLDPARPAEAAPRTIGGQLRRLARNLVGWLFVAVGVALLVLPGQGLLTILIGLVLVDVPGKRALERRVLSRPRILDLVNSMRRRRGAQPLSSH